MIRQQLCSKSADFWEFDLLGDIFIQAYRDLANQDEIIRKDAIKWLQSSKPAIWLENTNISFDTIHHYVTSKIKRTEEKTI